MHEKQPVCYNCGYSKKYIKSSSRLATILNAQILMFKNLGVVATLFYLFSLLANFLLNKVPWIIRNNIAFRQIKAKGELLRPPWLEYPEIEWGSIGWRMGCGESYLMKWDHWYKKLSKENKSNYMNRFPQPEEWKNFYSSRE